MRERTRLSSPVDYQVIRHNTDWADHVLRTYATAAAIAWVEPTTICDPACGDASILSAAYRLYPFEFAYLSDISRPGIEALSVDFPHTKSVHPIEVGIEPANLLVLTETLEHLPDPDFILRLGRNIAVHLIASSPVMRPGQRDDNTEHLWQFDRTGYERMLANAGWRTTQFTFLEFPGLTYDFGIWVCR